MVKLEDLGTEISKEINLYMKSVKDGVDEVTEKIGAETLKEVKSKAPVLSGKYKKSLSLKTEKQLMGNKKVTIFAKAPHYRLTHLLENGHALANGGRSIAIPHWGPAEEIAAKDYYNAIKEVIENGGSDV